MRDYLDFIEDIKAEVENIKSFLANQTFDDFKRSTLLQYAVVKSLENIGEASKHIPDNILDQYKEIRWKNIQLLRNEIAHEYFNIDLNFVWDLVNNRLTKLEAVINKMLSDLS